jgi:hypothetical protein
VDYRSDWSASTEARGVNAPLISRLLAVQLAFCSDLADELTIVGCAVNDPEVLAAVQRCAWRLRAFEKLARDAGGQAGRASFEFLTK